MDGGRKEAITAPSQQSVSFGLASCLTPLRMLIRLWMMQLYRRMNASWFADGMAGVHRDGRDASNWHSRRCQTCRRDSVRRRDERDGRRGGGNRRRPPRPLPTRNPLRNKRLADSRCRRIAAVGGWNMRMWRRWRRKPVRQPEWPPRRRRRRSCC